jgi:hypothetical protein
MMSILEGWRNSLSLKYAKMTSRSKEKERKPKIEKHRTCIVSMVYNAGSLASGSSHGCSVKFDLITPVKLSNQNI